MNTDYRTPTVALLEYLDRLAVQTKGLRLSRAKGQCCQQFALSDLELQDANGSRIQENTLVRNAVAKVRDGGFVNARVPAGAEPAYANVEPYSADQPPLIGAPAEGRLSSRPETDRFIREFASRERTSGAMWAKHVVNELLPELGFPPLEAKRLLRELESEGLVTTTKVPSRNNPEFLATRFHLNRDHPRVKAVLEAQDVPRGRNRPLIKLPPGSESLSEQLIRERR